VTKVRGINDWLLPEELAIPGTVLVMFAATESWSTDGTDLAFFAAAARHDGPVRFFKLNTDENPSVLKERHVRTLPTIILYVEGQEVARRTGSLDYRAISGMLIRKEKSS
jgi:thioredoxin 2